MSFINGPNILVTGGAGYVGSHACKELSLRGYCPIVLDDLSEGNEQAVRWGPLVCADIADASVLGQIVRDYRIDAAIHFAASAYVGESITDPGKYYSNNVAKTVAFTNTLLDSGVRQIIFSSSCATYGLPLTPQITESHSQLPINPYGDTKLAIEKLLRWYGEPYGLSWVALRYFNVAGADPHGDIGECHRKETHLVPLALHSTYAGHVNLRIFGDDYDTPDGTAIRDFVHVSDIAQAHVLALEYLRHGGESRAFNLGTGKGHSVREVIDAVQRITQSPVRSMLFPRRVGDPPCLVADPSMAHRHLRWMPKHSSLDEMVRTSHQWFTRRRLPDSMRSTSLLHHTATY